MSTEQETKKPESELGLDLDLHFLPAWAQKPPAANQYEKYTGEEGFEGRRGRRDDRGRGDRGPRRPDRPRPPGGGGPSGGPRREGGQDFRGRGGPRSGPGAPRVPERPQIKLPDIDVTFVPEEKGVESLARQIKLTGRAYPLFEIAYLVLKKPERYHVHLTSIKKEGGQPAQLIYVCGLDDTIWLDENEAMQHVLDRHFSTFYSIEKIPTDPPKGVYTFVAQCGISGTILGPPNYHDYQNKLSKLHQERFARMPFDAFKSRIRIVKDEAVVKKWLEEQSFRTEYTCLNIPETIKLNTREEVEKHFRETHLANVIKAVETYTLPGTTAVNLDNRGLQALLRRNYDEQMRFPLKVVNILSGQFARQGLQFFKVNKTVTHVAVARPHFLDLEASPVSEGIRKIVDFINTHPRTTRKKLLEGLAPGSTTAASLSAAPQPGTPAEEGATLPVVASPEAALITGDLHWLIHQGHVIEFANGILETAKRPVLKPARPEKKQEAKPGQTQQIPTPEGSAPETGAEVPAGAEESTEEQSVQGTVVQDESGLSAGADVPNEETASPSESGANDADAQGEGSLTSAEENKTGNQ
jgi:hypothetical protein